MSAFQFNPGGLDGVDAPLRAGLRRYLSSREREINAVAKRSFYCSGGPFAGNQIELEAGQVASAHFTVGRWSGRYEVVHGHRAEWRAA